MDFWASIRRVDGWAGGLRPARRGGGINFVARRDNLHTIQNWLPEWAPELRVRIFNYESLPQPEALPPGLWIFADVDRLTPACHGIAVAAWNGLHAKHGRRVRLLNRPGVSLSRKPLLDQLFSTGRNRFQVHEAADWRNVERFPVFVRLGTEHYGALTPLLHDPDALRHGLQAVQAQGYPPDDMLVVEYLDTSVEGVFRKYSVFRAGATFIAQHVFHSSDWHVKASVLKPTDALIEEDRRFRQDNPHLAEVREIFELAGMEYGRIDYAILDGRVQTWEINSNPTIIYRRADYRPDQMPAKNWFAKTLARSLREMARATL